MGPKPLAGDTWDTGEFRANTRATVAKAVRRHARQTPTGTWSRGRLLIGAAAAIIAVVAVVALIMAPSPRGGAGGLTGAPGDLTRSAGAPSGTASDVAIGGGSAPVGQPTATAPGTGTSEASPFAAVTIEAESPSVILTGSAAVSADDRASGGQLVTGVGSHPSGGAAGVVQIGLSLPSAGTYRFAIYYANGEGAVHTSAQAVVSGADPRSLNFPGNPKCCGVRTFDVALSAGSHALTITNDSGIAPSIDKVVISRA